jgi:hypothetical protein
MVSVLILLLLMVVLIVRSTLIVLLLAGRMTSSTSATVATSLLGQQDATNALVNRLQLRQIRRRNLDWIASNRQDHNELPRVQFVLVLDHLRALPIVLDARSLQRELFHLYGNGTSRLRFDHGNVVLRLTERSSNSKSVVSAGQKRNVFIWVGLTFDRYMFIIHGWAIMPPITTYLGFQSFALLGAVVSRVSYLTMCSPSAMTTSVLGT